MDTTHAGDGERLAAQTGRLRLLVRHLAGRALRARVEADDLVQEVFLRALTLPEGLPPANADGVEPRLVPLLVTLARHVVVDAARAARATKRRGVEHRLARSDWSHFATLEPAARSAGPFTRAAVAETERALERAFDGLLPEHRRVIGLRQFEGLSAAEAGRRMGRSESAVHSLYRRALQAWEAVVEGRP